MVTDFQTTKVYFSSWLPKSCPKLWEAIHSVFLKRNVKYAFLSDTEDIWCRDYMPIQITTDKMVSYKYWPDYLVNRHKQKYITDSYLMAQNLEKEYPGIEFKHLGLILDGGNVVKCGDTIVMTEKVFEENPNRPKYYVRKTLEDAFGCNILFLPWDRKEIYGHSDGIIHYLGENKILLTNYDDYSFAEYKSFKARLESKFEVITLKYPVERKNMNNWAYINYLQVGGLILVPQLGIEEDEMALEQIQKAIPDTYSVIGVPAIEAVKMGGALNCISWNIDDNISAQKVVKIISPLQNDAFSEKVIYEVLQQRLDFILPKETWYDINKAFENYWDEEAGIGNFVDCDSMYWSIKRQLSAEHILFPDDKLYRIVNVIWDFIDTIPGVIIH